MRKTVLIIAVILFSFKGKAQTWQSMAKMPVEFSFPVVVVLNGEIHVMGGGGPGGATDLHIRYKPSTDKWDTLASVPYKAQQPAGAVVKGKIHFCGGGFPNTGTRLDKHYFFDPDSNKWFKAANMPVATAIHEAVSFENKLYVMSGQPDKQLCETYDPVTNTWTQKNKLPDQYFWYGAIVAAPNAIYRFGGGGFTGPQYVAHKYDKSTDSWIPIVFLPIALHGTDGTLVNDSFICIAGGYNGGDKANAMVYNIYTGQYTNITYLPSERTYHNMVSIGGCIYSVGGNNNSDPAVATSLLKYCPAGSLSVNTLNSDNTLPYQVTKNNLKMTLSFGNDFLAQAVDITIIDISGKVIFKGKTDSNVFEYDAGNLNSALYFVDINLNGHHYIEKWVVCK